MKTRKITIKPVPGTGLAESKDDARRLREGEILPALAANQLLELDFANVEFATQSFMHALVSDAIRRYGEEIFEMITFVNCTDEVQQVVLTVFEYTMDASDVSGGLQSDQ
jgi:hypothetical protein